MREVGAGVHGLVDRDQRRDCVVNPRHVLASVPLLARDRIDVFESVEVRRGVRGAGSRLGETQVLEQSIERELWSTLARKDYVTLDVDVRTVRRRPGDRIDERGRLESEVARE